MQQVVQQAPTAAATNGCIPVDKLLKEVSEAIVNFEAKKLGQLKTELEAFSKKKATVKENYKKKYADYVKAWKEQNYKVIALQKNIKCVFPDDQWKDLIKKCLCAQYTIVKDLQDDYDERKDCSAGELEKARDDAKKAFDDAKAYLEILSNNGAKIEEAQAANAKAIKTIGELLQGDDKALAIRAFWADLLPRHLDMAPAGLDPDCLKDTADERLWDLCDDYPAPDPKAPHPVPWLVDPTDGPEGQPSAYDHELDCAWTWYRNARDASGLADAAYAAAPDDLAAAAKALKAAKDGLKAAIDACLKECTPPAACCGAPVETPDGPVVAAPPEPAPPATGYGDDAAPPEPAPPEPAPPATGYADDGGYAKPADGDDTPKPDPKDDDNSYRA